MPVFQNFSKKGTESTFLKHSKRKSNKPRKHTTSFRCPYNVHNVKTTSHGCQNNVVCVLGRHRSSLQLNKNTVTEHESLFYLLPYIPETIPRVKFNVIPTSFLKFSKYFFFSEYFIFQIYKILGCLHH